MTWKRAQKWEKDWHGNCVNSFNEEKKQLVYASRMGLKTSPTDKTPYNFDLEGKSILDIGSGPYSLLLKCVNFNTALAVDPLMDEFPQWIRDRYKAHRINTMAFPCEKLKTPKVHFDEVWIYNVLEHTKDPELIIKNALSSCKILRIFEWLNTPSNIGHPQTLKEETLNKWLGGIGKIENMSNQGLFGTAFYGIFKGNKYKS